MRKIYLLIIFVFYSVISYGRPGAEMPDTSGFHELTMYVFAPAVDIKWDSPSVLYKSVLASYINKLLHPQKRFLGHMAFRLNSTLLKKPLYVGIASDGVKDMRAQLFKHKIGLGLLGYPFTARMETEEMLKPAIAYNASKKKMAFIKYRINAAAAERILAFLASFSKKFNNRYAPNDFYGGAFWPLYDIEGSGCSALCLAALASGNLLFEEAENWKVKCKIPISLIGGDVNGGKKIKIAEVKKSRSWHTGAGIENKDYVDFEIYDPGALFKWIHATRSAKQTAYSPLTENNMPGLYIDCRNINASDGQAIREREKPNLFLDEYYRKVRIDYTAMRP